MSVVKNNKLTVGSQKTIFFGVHSMSYLYWLIALIGRGCMAAIFVLSGVQKILTWNTTLSYMSGHGLQYVEFLLFFAASIEIFAGTLFFLGIKRHQAATVLALYLIPVTYVFHGFWMITDPALQMAEYINFMKNLSIFGGLVCLSLPEQTSSCKNK